MQPDDKLCYCFHISKRKIINFVRIHKPKVPSQISECGGAGTGCGWCIPFLRKCFDAGKTEGAELKIGISATEYAQQRADYVRSGQGTPAANAEPLPELE